jgi:hypothetical protein
LLQKENLSERFILDLINNIIKIKIDDLIEYNVKAVEPIKDGSGLRIKLIAKLDRIRQPISIDIAVSDPVTPNVIQNNYTTMINSEKVNINVYPYETILAEKLQTVISLGITSSKIFFDKLDIEDTLKAIQNTFNYRNTSHEYNYVLEGLNNIRNNHIQIQLWDRYVYGRYFAKDILFADLMDSVTVMIERIYDHR